MTPLPRFWPPSERVAYPPGENIKKKREISLPADTHFQGLRGIASALVVLTHLARAWNDDLFWPASQENASPRFFQLPYLRILIQGRIGVTIFAFVTGYVCALKPIKLCKQGNQEAAFVSISKSALRRFPRLFLPAAAATCLSFVICEFGLYAMAKHQDSWWLDVGTPARAPYLGQALVKLVHNLITTWTSSMNTYDPNQWTLLPLLRGSMWVYVFMVATAYVKPRFRMLASLGLWVYFYIAADCELTKFFFRTLYVFSASYTWTDFLSSHKPLSVLSFFGAHLLPIYRITTPPQPSLQAVRGRPPPSHASLSSSV